MYADKLLDPGTRSTLEDIHVRSKVSTTLPMRSSELARLAAISTDTLRYYERHRLLPVVPRSASGYRLFPAQALQPVITHSAQPALRNVSQFVFLIAQF